MTISNDKILQFISSLFKEKPHRYHLIESRTKNFLSHYEDFNLAQYLSLRDDIQYKDSLFYPHTRRTNLDQNWNFSQALLFNAVNNEDLVFSFKAKMGKNHQETLKYLASDIVGFFRSNQRNDDDIIIDLRHDLSNKLTEVFSHVEVKDHLLKNIFWESFISKLNMESFKERIEGKEFPHDHLFQLIEEHYSIDQLTLDIHTKSVPEYYENLLQQFQYWKEARFLKQCL